MYANFSKKPLIVYLDQNKWIDLTKAQMGRADSVKFKPVLEKIIDVVKLNKAVFPLSWVHFIETRKRGDPKKRKELAETMAEISQGITIIPKSQILINELNLEFAKVFGISSTKPNTIFGYGMSMILGRNFMDDELKKYSDSITEYSRQRAIEILTSKDQIVSFLVGDDELLNTKLILGLEEINKSFIKNEEMARMENKGSDKDLPERHYLGLLTRDLQPKFIEILNRYGKTMDDFFGLGLENVRNFFHNVPTLDVELELTLNLNKHWDRNLKTNDTRDVAFASVAIPYCDIVVTEVFLRTLAIRQKLDKKYDTKIFNDLIDLLPILNSL